MQEKIKIGKIVSAHGIAGCVKVVSYADDLGVYDKLFFDDGSEFKFVIKSKVKNLIITKLDNIETRNAAEALKGQFIYINKSQLANTEENEFYIFELQGLKVLNQKSEEIGHVIGVYNYNAGDIIEVKFANEKSKMFLFKKEYFPTILPKEGYIVINDSVLDY
jgi:16S rRNA processing protein RimM